MALSGGRKRIGGGLADDGTASADAIAKKAKGQGKVVAVVLAASTVVPATVAAAVIAAAVAETAGRRTWGPALAPREPKRTNRKKGLAPLWGRGRSEGVRKLQREMHSSYVPGRRSLEGQV